MTRIKCYGVGEAAPLIAANTGLLLVHFYSPLQSASSTLHRELDDVAPTFDGRIQFAEVEPLKDRELAQDLAIEHLPTLILFQGTEEVERVEGDMQPEALAEFLDTVASFYTSGPGPEQIY
ncbi:MAG: thioredoxin family protein [Planctomycetota bacterium]